MGRGPELCHTSETVFPLLSPKHLPCLTGTIRTLLMERVSSFVSLLGLSLKLNERGISQLQHWPSNGPSF